MLSIIIAIVCMSVHPSVFHMSVCPNRRYGCLQLLSCLMLLVRDTCHNLFPRDRYPHTWLCQTPHQFMATLKFDADHPDSDLSHEYKVDLSHFCLMKYEIPNTIHFISICLTCIVDRRQMYINGKVQTIKHV